MKKYKVSLKPAEREELKGLLKKGKAAAYKIKHANILLSVDAEGMNQSDEVTAKNCHCHINTVANVRQRFVELGYESALNWNQPKQPSRKVILDGEGEAQLLKIACSKAPEGRTSWTLRMLADLLIELEVVETISHETVRQTLKKTKLNLT